MSRISPVILLVIVILAIAFFIIGFLQLLIRCLSKRPPPSASRPSSPRPGSHPFQRQLQHLFRMHDSGLDQAAVDALPVFFYREITGAKEPFDCAVCLCEFSDGDRLKLIPNCSHAFHVHCIETWLLSSSTCPLCRSLIGCGIHPHDQSNIEALAARRGHGCTQQNYAGTSRVVVPIRLGKFRSANKQLGSSSGYDNGEEGHSSSNIDGRRCFSMGAFQYVVGDTKLQVALSSSNRDTVCNESKMLHQLGNRLHPRSRDDSFSLSKIWLWSKKGPDRAVDTAVPTPNPITFS